MIHRTVVSLILSFTTSVGVLLSGGGDSSVVMPPTRPSMIVVDEVNRVFTKDDRAHAELAEQDRKAKIPTIQYWDKVARCESQSNWKDKGTWAGGLGIYTKGRFTPKSLRHGAGTWEYFGGEEYAPSPDKATKVQQIVIANRIALFGHTYTFTLPAGLNGRLMTFKYNKKPVGFGGWGCISNTIGKPRKKDLQ